MEKDAPNRFKDWFNELTPEDVKLPLDWKNKTICFSRNVMFKEIYVLIV